MRSLVFDCGTADLIEPATGHSVFWSQLLNALAGSSSRRNVELTAIVRGDAGTTESLREAFPEIAFIPSRPAAVRDLGRWDLIVPRRLRIRAGEVLFQHAHEPQLAGRYKRVSMVYDLAFEDPIDAATFSSQLVDELRSSTRRAIRHSAEVCALSRFTVEQLTGIYGVLPSRCSVVYPGVDHAAAARAADWSAEAQVAYDVHRPFALHVGVIQPRKNILPLLHAWNERDDSLRHYELLFVGMRGWNNGSIVYALEAAGDVRWLGHLPRRHVWGLLAAASLVVALGRSEGFGLPALEAMAVGTPVVRGDQGGVVEVDDDTSLVVDPQQGTALGAALSRAALLKNDLEWRERCRARAAAFTWERAAETVLDVCMRAAS